jgi:hypothetical protein
MHKTTAAEIYCPTHKYDRNIKVPFHERTSSRGRLCIKMPLFLINTLLLAAATTTTTTQDLQFLFSQVGLLLECTD